MFIEKKDAITGYKAFNYDWRCRDFQYEVGKTYHMDGTPVYCGGNGFHFCREIKDTIKYYIPMMGTKLAKVLAWGEVIHRDDGKSVCNNIEIVAEVQWNSFSDIVKKQAKAEGKRSIATESDAVIGSDAVRWSNAVSGSNAVSDSNAVSYSNAVIDSNAVRWSNAVSGSNAVSDSNAVSGSNAVSYSNAVIDSNAVDTCFGLLECKGAYQCLFVHKRNGISNLVFGKKISDKKFNEIHSALLRHLDTWRPEPTNLTSFYLKCGSDWKLTPIQEASSVSNEEAWKSMPAKAIEYLAGLKEFNASTFKKITGITAKKSVGKNKEAL